VLSADRQVEQVADGVFLETLSLPMHLTEEERSFLKKGAVITAPALREKTPFKDGTLLVVSHVSFPPCDFLPEALACSVIGLVEKLIDTKIVEIPVSFNEATYRYEFDFPPGC